MKKGKAIRIDENAHHILLEAKEEMRENGIHSPTLSDAVRWIKRNGLKGGEKP